MQSHEKQKIYNQKYSTQQYYHLQWKEKKEFYRKVKLKELISTKQDLQ